MRCLFAALEIDKMGLVEQRARANRVIEKLNCRGGRPVAVVLNTGDANSYGLISNLGREGIPIISVSCDPINITLVSRYAEGLVFSDRADSEHGMIELLEHLGQNLRPRPVLLVNGDDQLMLLLRYEERIRALFHFPYASLEVVSTLIDKGQFYSALAQHSVPHAKTFRPKHLEEMSQMAIGLEYPYILKPVNSPDFSSRFGNKCLCADSPEEAVAHYEKMQHEKNGVLFQKRMMGTERLLIYTYFSADSRPLALCSYRKVRIYPEVFGNACVCETVDDVEARTIFLDLLKKMSYRGLAEAEFHRDERDGQLKLVEINARSTTQDRLPAYCGVNMEYIAYQDVLGNWEQKDCIVNQKLGVLWIDLVRDFMAVFSSQGYIARGELTIRDWWRSLRGPRVFAYWAWDDPRPAIKLLVRLLGIYVFKKERIHDIRVLLRRMLQRQPG